MSVESVPGTETLPRLARLMHGDNLEVLRAEVDASSVDLVYLDPPFNTRQQFTMKPGAGRSVASGTAFVDQWTWDAGDDDALQRLRACERSEVRACVCAFESMLGRNGLMSYLVMMTPRLLELHRVLKPTGSIYLHCDSATSHYLKILMDAIFGVDHFLNNIVWLYGLGGSSPRYWPRKHDDLLWYARTAGKHFFQPSLVPATSARLRGQMKKAPDYWDIPSINNMAKERVGYPTQKPEALLMRVVESSCPADGVVLDPFCGSGTTLVVADRLQRHWIGIDCNAEAIAVAQERLRA